MTLTALLALCLFPVPVQVPAIAGPPTVFPLTTDVLNGRITLTGTNFWNNGANTFLLGCCPVLLSPCARCANRDVCLASDACWSLFMIA